MLGAKSIAVTRSGSKSGELIAAGADNVGGGGEEDVRDIIFDITDGLGADLIYWKDYHLFGRRIPTSAIR